MGLFTTLNPFYWKKKYLQAEENYDHACECFNHLQDENVELKQRIEILSEPYQYPNQKDLVNGYALTMVKPDVWKNIDTGAVLKTFTKKEAKLLLDNEMLKQQLEAYEEFYKELSKVAGSGVMEKVETLVKQRDEAQFEEKKTARNLKSKQAQLDQCHAKLVATEAQLAISREQNRKWLETALGFGVNDFTLLTKSLWGSKIGVVEFDDDKAS